MTKRLDVSTVLVGPNHSLKDTMRVIDRGGMGCAVIVQEPGKNNKLLGLVTDGDIRRAILDGSSLDGPISNVMNTAPVTLDERGEDQTQLMLKVKDFIEKDDMRSSRSQFIPVVRDSIVLDIVRMEEIVEWNKRRGSVRAPTTVQRSGRVLVIGGAGYLGATLTENLLERGYRVRVLDSYWFGYDPLAEFQKPGHPWASKLEIVRGDMRNIDTVVSSLRDVDAVVLLAAIVGDPASKISPVETIETNFLSSQVVAEACKYQQINRLLFASTCSVYGVGAEILDETAPLNPVSLYARSKIMAEQKLLALADENFAPCALRMSTLFGPSRRMRFDLVVNTLTMKALTEKKISIFGGAQWRPLLHVHDAAEAFARGLEVPLDYIRGEVFNVGSTKQNYQIVELGRIVERAVPGTQMQVQDDTADARDYRVSFDKIQKILGYEPTRSVDKGVKEILDLFKQGIFPEPQLPRYYNHLREQ